MKIAFLTTFHATTRLVFDVPEEYKDDIDRFIDEHVDMFSRTAREKMLNNGIGDYLCGDNIEIEEDVEVPADDTDILDIDPERRLYD